MYARRVLDPALATGIGVVGVLEVVVPFSSRQGHGSVTWSILSVIGASACLSWRRSRPLAALVTMALVLAAAWVAGPPYVLFYGHFVPLLVGVYSVARYGAGRAPELGALVGALTLIGGELSFPELRPPGERIFHWIVFIACWLAGWGLSRYEQRARLATRRAVEAEGEAARQAMAAILEERTRIARELHDVVAHAISLMVVQAGAAAQVVRDDPATVARALEEIRRAGSGALTEMRRVVTLLREDETPDLVPQPGIAALPALVDDARVAGLDATLTLTGAGTEIPAGLGLAIYRIVQEALTNVRRHSGASKVQVRVSCDDGVCVHVRDDGRGADSTSFGGHGITGMRERAALYGGRLTAATAATGGFEVRASFPVAGK